MNRFARTTALTAFAGVALFTTPAVAAASTGPGVSATPHVTYVSDGTTVAFTFTLTGTQHPGTGPEHTSVPSPGILSFSADFGDGKGNTGGDAGPINCTSKGATPAQPVRAVHLPLREARHVQGEGRLLVLR